MEAHEMSNQDQEGLAGEVAEHLGMSDGEQNLRDERKEHDVHAEPKDDDRNPSNESLAVQKRLKAQKRAHEREVRELHARIGDLESRMTQPNMMQHDQSTNHYQPPMGGDIEGHIHKAVSIALQHKENEERKAHEAQMQAHVHRKYQDFQKHLDQMGDKYDDFHDVVLAPDAEYTPTMRDYAARTMAKHGPGSAGEVLYKLGKNPEELKRIARLHPDDQAEELHKLSLALSTGGEMKGSSHKAPLGNIKSNPVVNAHAVTDKTPIGELRKRMKAGWK